MKKVTHCLLATVTAAALHVGTVDTALGDVCDPRYRGDFDLDNDVDLDDHAPMVDCLSGPTAGVGPGCEHEDLDTNGTVDLADVALFYVCSGESGVTPPAMCELPLQQHGIDSDWDTAEYPLDVAGTIGVGRKLEVDSAGVYHAAYTGTPGNDVFWVCSTDGGMNWSTPEQVSGAGSGSGGSVVVGPDDSLHFAYRALRPGGVSAINYRRRTELPTGPVWSPIKNIGGLSTDGFNNPSITVDDNQRIHVAWHTGDSPLTTQPKVFYTRSVDNGANFEAPRQLNPAMPYRPAVWPRFLVRGTSGDTVAVAWRSADAALLDWDADVAVSTDGGATFSVETPAHNPNFDEQDPESVVDTAGNVHLAYHIGPGANGIQYLRRVAGTGLWTTPVTLSPDAGAYLGWAYDSIGVLWLLWKDQRDSVNAIDARSDLMARSSVDGGINWGTAEFITDRCFTEVGTHSIAVGPGGAPAVIWIDGGAGSSDGMYVKTRDPGP
ncbi:MAG: exo-alpha-sialidase [bacterium]|nr:exo-alpha-sialidase [bacterium]